MPRFAACRCRRRSLVYVASTSRSSTSSAVACSRFPSRDLSPTGLQESATFSGRELVTAYSSTRRSRRALAMTDSELRVMAALAQMGLMSSPKTG